MFENGNYRRRKRKSKQQQGQALSCGNKKHENDFFDDDENDNEYDDDEDNDENSNNCSNISKKIKLENRNNCNGDETEDDTNNADDDANNNKYATNNSYIDNTSNLKSNDSLIENSFDSTSTDNNSNSNNFSNSEKLSKKRVTSSPNIFDTFNTNDINVSKSAFTIDNLIYGNNNTMISPTNNNNTFTTHDYNNNNNNNGNYNRDNNANLSAINADSLPDMGVVYSSNKENNEKSQNITQNANNLMKRAKTPPGLENLPIPPAIYPLVSTKFNASTTDANSTKNKNLPANALNYQSAAAAAAAAAALFNPAALAPFLAVNNMKNPHTANTIQGPTSINNLTIPQSDTINAFRNQLFNRYHPYMNQLALAASLSSANQSSTTTKSNLSTNNKLCGKS